MAAMRSSFPKLQEEFSVEALRNSTWCADRPADSRHDVVCGYLTDEICEPHAFRGDLDGRIFAAAAKVRARVCKSCLGGLIDDASHVMDNLNHTRYRETP